MVRLQGYEIAPGEGGFYQSIDLGIVDELPLFQPTDERLAAKIDEFGSNYEEHRLPGGETIGLSVVNADRLGQRAKLIMTTANSSARQNPGHVFEVCVHAAANQNEAIISADTPKKLSWQERRHLRADGRFTYLDADLGPRGLPSFEAVGQLLTNLGYKPTHLSANHEAAHFEMAVAMGLDEGSIRSIFANGLHIAAGAHSRGDAEIEDVKGRLRRHVDPDPWAPNNARRRQVRQAATMEPVYHRPAQPIEMAAVWVRAALINDLFAFRPAWKHSDLAKPIRHPVIRDAAQVLRRHEGARLAAYFNVEDEDQTIDDILLFGYGLAKFAMARDKEILLLIGEGTRDAHTDHPEGRWQAEQWSFAY